METITKQTLPTTILAKIVAETGADPKTVRRAFQRKPGKGETRRRVDAALKAAGFLAALLLALGCTTDGSGISTQAVSLPDASTAAQAPDTAPSAATLEVRAPNGPEAQPDARASSTPDVGAEAMPHDTTPAACLPLEQTGCPAGQACYYGTTPGVYTARDYCAPVGTGAPGTACGVASDCAAGSTCIEVSCSSTGGCVTTSRCLPFCGPAVECLGLPIPTIMKGRTCKLLTGSVVEMGAGYCM